MGAATAMGATGTGTGGKPGIPGIVLATGMVDIVLAEGENSGGRLTTGIGSSNGTKLIDSTACGTRSSPDSSAILGTSAIGKT